MVVECQAEAVKEDLGVNQDWKGQEKDPKRDTLGQSLQQEEKFNRMKSWIWNCFTLPFFFPD